jgi:hypothetical protein
MSVKPPIHSVRVAVLLIASGMVWTTAVGETARRRCVEADWALQDNLHADGLVQIDSIAKPLDELRDGAADLWAEYDRLIAGNVTPDDERWVVLYHQAGARRRAQRLNPYLEHINRVVFTKHYNMGGSHYAYTEGQSDAQAERNFVPGTALCILEMRGLYGKVITLIDDKTGVIRDPDVSWDGQRILFAWKKSDRLDDYHLYDMDVATRAIHQLTHGLGFADYEPAYLPNGDIVFTSTRCVQTVDCWWTEVSNLYTCDTYGRHLRRLGYDQVHTNYPQVTPDGRVIYTRWDYSDRGQIYPQGLFQMNPDGTHQTEFYGNNSWFPTSIVHARPIPRTRKVVAIFTGHHTHQRGQLGIIDPALGRQENDGAQLIAPRRATPAVRIDAYGQDGPQFQYPYPLGATAFLVTMNPVHDGNRRYSRPYAIYWIDIDGRRELLAADQDISCNQPVPLRPRARPMVRPNRVDYTQNTGVYFVHDVYAGPGLQGVPRGTVKKLRVVALEFRAAGVGSNGSSGPAGGAMSSTPVSIGNGCWDPKIILGDATVYADGSACFTVPALTPVYFQALDDKGHAVQTMRSWSTLQPGEMFSCVGCHESKNSSPPTDTQTTLAMNRGPQPLAPFYGPQRGFSFVREVQPILDKHCTRCHTDRAAPQAVARNSQEPDSAFSLLGDSVVDAAAKRHWSNSYLMLTNSVPDKSGQRYQGDPNGPWVKWISVQSEPHMLPPYHSGAARSPLIRLLEDGHEGVTLRAEERHKLAAWIDLLVPYCGDYTEANAWNESERAKYAHFTQKRLRMKRAEDQNIAEYLGAKAEKHGQPAESLPKH